MAEADTKVGGIRWLSISNTPEAEARLRKFMPTAYISVVKPGPGRVGILAPTTLLFEDYVVVAGSQVSDEDAYKLAKVLHDQQDKLAAVAKIYSLYDKDKLARDHQIPFHPGAIKYYKEKGIWHGQ